MKRKLMPILLICLLMVIFSACGCKHQWADATCTTAKTCNLCGETEGSPNGHVWNSPTCTAAKNCSVCGTTEGDPLEHTWVEATCTQARNCSTCGTTEGTVLEHSWVAATCSASKNCSICGEIEGDPLPHSIDTWTTLKEASCSETGIMEGLCSVCLEKSTKEISLLEHTPGDWETTKECTATTPGERSRNCTVCGATLETESFEMTAEEIEAAYKAECGTYTYKEIARSPGEYKGKKAKFTGEVIQVMQEELYGIMVYVLRVDVTKNGRYYDDTVYVTYYADADDPRIHHHNVRYIGRRKDLRNRYGSICHHSQI